MNACCLWCCHPSHSSSHAIQFFLGLPLEWGKMCQSYLTQLCCLLKGVIHCWQDRLKKCGSSICSFNKSYEGVKSLLDDTKLCVFCWKKWGYLDEGNRERVQTVHLHNTDIVAKQNWLKICKLFNVETVHKSLSHDHLFRIVFYCIFRTAYYYYLYYVYT